MSVKTNQEIFSWLHKAAPNFERARTIRVVTYLYKRTLGGNKFLYRKLLFAQNDDGRLVVSDTVSQPVDEPRHLLSWYPGYPSKSTFSVVADPQNPLADRPKLSDFDLVAGPQDNFMY